MNQTEFKALCNRLEYEEDPILTREEFHDLTGEQLIELLLKLGSSNLTDLNLEANFKTTCDRGILDWQMTQYHPDIAMVLQNILSSSKIVALRLSAEFSEEQCEGMLRAIESKITYLTFTDGSQKFAQYFIEHNQGTTTTLCFNFKKACKAIFEALEKNLPRLPVTTLRFHVFKNNDPLERMLRIIENAPQVRQLGYRSVDYSSSYTANDSTVLPDAQVEMIIAALPRLAHLKRLCLPKISPKAREKLIKALKQSNLQSCIINTGQYLKADYCLLPIDEELISKKSNTRILEEDKPPPYPDEDTLMALILTKASRKVFNKAYTELRALVLKGHESAAISLDAFYREYAIYCRCNPEYYIFIPEEHLYEAYQKEFATGPLSHAHDLLASQALFAGKQYNEGQEKELAHCVIAYALICSREPGFVKNTVAKVADLFPSGRGANILKLPVTLGKILFSPKTVPLTLQCLQKLLSTSQITREQYTVILECILTKNPNDEIRKQIEKMITPTSLDQPGSADAHAALADGLGQSDQSTARILELLATLPAVPRSAVPTASGENDTSQLALSDDVSGDLPEDTGKIAYLVM